MNITCPCCHAKYSLDAALEGEAAGELQLIIAQAGPLARPLLSYLGMFRSKSRALSFDRAVRLAGEVIALGADQRVLAAALAETVEALRQKRDAGQIQPLKNHNYLKRVLESVGDRAGDADFKPQTTEMKSGEFSGESVKVSKRAQALSKLEEWSRE